ncbi:hypothetical protein LTR85_010415 [Meristemomyces frigidus]|nr:hypothetical protein LTR85_010415 [Meristemomyces frigidus]
MCLLKVKEEEDYSVPARYKRVSRVRRYSPSPPRVERITRRSYVEERRPSPTYALPPPAPAPLPPPTIIEPPPPEHSVRSETVRSRSRHTSRAPSVRAPSRVSVTQSHYVEVDEDNSTSSSSSSSEDVRSRATSHHTRKTSRSAKAPSTAPPASEYSIHEREREVRRERRASRPPREEYETFRYVPAPPTDSGRSRSRAGSGNFDPRASRESYAPRRETRVQIEDEGGRRDVRVRR